MKSRVRETIGMGQAIGELDFKTEGSTIHIVKYCKRKTVHQKTTLYSERGGFWDSWGSLSSSQKSHWFPTSNNSNSTGLIPRKSAYNEPHWWMSAGAWNDPHDPNNDAANVGGYDVWWWLWHIISCLFCTHSLCKSGMNRQERASWLNGLYKRNTYRYLWTTTTLQAVY